MLVVDRFEGEWAVVEHSGMKQTFNIPRSLLPGGTREGDVIELLVKVKDDDTKDRRKSIEDFLDKNMLDC